MDNPAVTLNDYIAEHPTVFFGVIIAICVVIIALMIIVGAAKRKKKKALLGSDPNLVEIVFDESVTLPAPVAIPGNNTAGYVLYSVNDEPAKLLGRSLILPAGETTLDVEYFMLPHGARFAKSMGRSRYTLTTVPGKKYNISFDYMDMCLSHKEGKQ